MWWETQWTNEPHRKKTMQLWWQEKQWKKTWGKQPNFFIKINGKPFGTKLLRLPQGRRAFWSGFWSLDFGFVFFLRFGMWWESNERDRKRIDIENHEQHTVLNLGTTEGLKELCVAINRRRELHLFSCQACWIFWCQHQPLFFEDSDSIPNFAKSLASRWCLSFFWCSIFSNSTWRLWNARFLATLGANVIFQTWRARGCNLRESVQTCLVIMVFQG